MSLKKYFITATGTEVGKTLVTAALCYQARESGYSVKAIKPVISGYEENAENDITELMRAQNVSIYSKNADKAALYKLKEPISPDMAAKREGKSISIEEIADFCSKSAEYYKDYLFIEGAGGIMVPLNDRATTADLIKKLNVPIILVGGTYLGAISHILTSVDSAKSHGIDIEMIVLSESKEPQASLDEMKEIIERHTNLRVVGVPYICETPAWKHAPDLLNKLKSEEFFGSLYGTK